MNSGIKGSAPAILVDRQPGLSRILVAMREPYFPVPTWVLNLDLFSLAIFPVWMIGSFLLRWLRPTPTPPRAVFEITNERFKLTLRSQAHGEVTTFDWPRDEIVEARANKYAPGLWIHVRGIVKETYLEDVLPEIIELLEQELHSVLGNDDSSAPS